MKYMDFQMYTVTLNHTNFGTFLGFYTPLETEKLEEHKKMFKKVEILLETRSVIKAMKYMVEHKDLIKDNFTIHETKRTDKDASGN